MIIAAVELLFTDVFFQKKNITGTLKLKSKFFLFI